MCEDGASYDQGNDQRQYVQDSVEHDSADAVLDGDHYSEMHEVCALFGERNDNVRSQSAWLLRFLRMRAPTGARIVLDIDFCLC